MMMCSKQAPVDTIGYWWVPMGTSGYHVPVGAYLSPICANCSTCSWETLTMLNTQLVTGKHGLFWGHESEDIQTILIIETICRSSTSLFKKCFCHSLIDEGRNILQANNQMYPCLDVMR